jgi:hypothetical protein
MPLWKKILIGVASVVALLIVLQVIDTLMFRDTMEGRTTNPYQQSQTQQPSTSPSPEEENLWEPSRDEPLGDDPETAPAPLDTNCWGC